MRKKLWWMLAMLLTLLPWAVAQADTLTLPANLKAIEAEAFAGDRSLDVVVLPEGLTTIGPRAFAGSSLREIYLPASLVEIAEDAFEGCDIDCITSPRNSNAYAWAKRSQNALLILCIRIVESIS